MTSHCSASCAGAADHPACTAGTPPNGGGARSFVSRARQCCFVARDERQFFLGCDERPFFLGCDERRFFPSSDEEGWLRSRRGGHFTSAAACLASSSARA